MDEQKIEYDVHEDLRFPISLLYKSLWILKRHGYSRFRDYANRVNMPNQDIERVLNKHKYETDPEFRTLIHQKLKTIQQKFEGSEFELSEKDIPF